MSETNAAIDQSDLLKELCEKHGLARRAKEIFDRVRLAIGIKTARTEMSQLALGQSRIGGIPDLPVEVGKEYSADRFWRGTSWPAVDGIALDFVCQIDLSQVREFPASSTLPSAGHLLFFIGDDSKRWKRPGIQSCVLYTNGELRRPSASWELPEVRTYLPTQLTFESCWQVPHEGSSWVQSIGLSEAELRGYDRVYRDLVTYKKPYYDRTLTWLMGHTHIINGLENPDVPPPSELLKEDGETGWVLLLQLSGCEEAGMSVGDLGWYSFMIHPRDLAAKDFSKCWVWLETT